MRVGILTSSRADYGIYYSLLRALATDVNTEFGLFVFGTHLSAEHGMTVGQIESDGYPIYERIDTMPAFDDAAGISRAMGKTITNFAAIWERWAGCLDVVIALGDRYEMFAAVAATVSFGVPVAHLHGGETSLGAIDDKFRHAITQMSTLHFTATPAYAEKVAQLIGTDAGIHYVGAPSLDGLAEMPLLTIAEMKHRFGIDFDQPTILSTFHPETVGSEKNENYGKELCRSLNHLTGRYQVVITMPNADTMGSVLRRQYIALAEENKRVIAIESFGKIGYFSAMKYCAFLLGNTSSGIIEAASFGKYAINLGDRQAGRAHSKNLLTVPVQQAEIQATVVKLETKNLTYSGANAYLKSGDAATEILHILKHFAISKGQ
jgi:GDP/UDP-N,N'-diacetylbacillosamine 2-epimerase (hydrolysing)